MSGEAIIILVGVRSHGKIYYTAECFYTTAEYQQLGLEMRS